MLQILTAVQKLEQLLLEKGVKTFPASLIRSKIEISRINSMEQLIHEVSLLVPGSELFPGTGRGKKEVARGWINRCGVTEDDFQKRGNR